MALLKLEDTTPSFWVLAAVCVFAAGAVGNYFDNRPGVQEQRQAAREAAPKAQEQAQASDPFAGKPWRQWSEDEMTEFMRRALIACVKKADPKQEHDCYGVVNTIADDWKAHHG
jgi:hypothetical protein